MASHQPVKKPKTDRYIVFHIHTTCDDHGMYVTRDSAETIELGWILLDGTSLDEIAHDSVLIKPENTPITQLCTSLTTITFDNVKNAGSFRDAVTKFSAFYQEYIISKELEAYFVTLDAWNLRVQLPREARDKAVILPPYLQHSRTYDLRTEYQRWQRHHPNALPFGSSNLANICAALEVEPVQTSAPIKHNLPFHLQSLAPSSPRRALEEAETLSRVLRGLVRHSQPPQDHADVLSSPMDADADIRSFMAEESKILHMSGLPHDTTQSELESWFTQHGGRPIAFYTFRQVDAAQPSGTGFAVFTTHAEAAESLGMNGRALNEKAIEISPSSQRVFEKARAMAVLQTFPPSKNRPRPGDWTCPMCGFSNFQRRTNCFRCSFPAAASHGHQDAMGYPPYGYGHGMGQHQMQHHGAPRGGSGHGAVPFRAGDWRCGTDGCGYHNFAKNATCLRCGAPKSSAVPVTDNAFRMPMPGPPSNYGMVPPMGNAGLPQFESGGFAPHQFGNNMRSGPGGGYGSGGMHGPPGWQGPPMGNHYDANSGLMGYSSHGMHSGHLGGGSFDRRDHMEGGLTPSHASLSSVPATSAAPSQTAATSTDDVDDQFAFITAGMGGLGVKEDLPRGRSAQASASQSKTQAA